MTYQIHKNILPAFAAGFLVACAGTDPTLDGGAAKATFSMQMVSGSATQARLNASNVSAQQDEFSPSGSNVTITSARVNVGRVKFTLPGELTCSDVTFVEDNGGECENELAGS